MNLRLLDWIWHVRGSVPLAPGQSNSEAFRKIDLLFHQRGTRHEMNSDTLTFSKKDQAAQDKMSVFDSGTLWIERRAGGSVLRYHLISRALLFCFLVPLLFVGFAQLTIYLNSGKPPAKAASAKDAQKKIAKDLVVPLNPIDKFLGAPEPEKPKAGEDKPAGRNKKPTPTSAYVFAVIFVVLYIVGRILEDVLIKRVFRKSLRNSYELPAGDLERSYQGTI